LKQELGRINSISTKPTIKTAPEPTC